MATPGKEETWVDHVKTVVYALLIATVFRSIFFQPFWIPSESMKSTLLIGDFMFVNKMAYGYSRYSCEIPLTQISLCPFIPERFLGGEPERGDVVVFRHPHNRNDMVKRLVGLPGDQIQMKGGVLYINGAMAPQVADGVFEEINEAQGPMRNRPACANAPLEDGAVCQKPRAIETLPEGQSHMVLNIADGQPADDTGVFTVPEGQYFMMGDNRDNSLDSRFDPASGGVGFVPAKYLLGRADRVIFSSAGRSMLMFWTWRSDRFFHAVQ